MATLELLYEASQLISLTTIQGVFFGINTSLYFLYAQLFYRQYHKASSNEQRKFIIPFLCNSLMVLAAGLELGAGIRLMHLVYIAHGGLDGEPMMFETESLNNDSGVMLLVQIPSFIIGTLNSFMQLWRTWVIWATSPYRLVITISLFILVIAGLSVDIYLEALPDTTPDNVGPMLGTILLALDLGFTILVLLLINGRIIVSRRRHIRLMGTSSESTSQYTGIISMLIESYALDAAWSIASVISYALAAEGNPISLDEIFNNPGDQITVIAFLLVSYRVLLGRAWTQETGKQLSTIRWNHDLPEDTTNVTSFDNTPVLGSRTTTEDNGALT